jgi:hypothetical protein
MPVIRLPIRTILKRIGLRELNHHSFHIWYRHTMVVDVRGTTDLCCVFQLQYRTRAGIGAVPILLVRLSHLYPVNRRSKDLS